VFLTSRFEAFSMKYLISACLIGAAISGRVNAEPLAAVTATNQLIRFDSAAPGTLTGSADITGLTAGDVIAGIDMRPANNLLYAFTTDAGLGGSAGVHAQPADGGGDASRDADG
jgi:hypothetical protein